MMIGIYRVVRAAYPKFALPSDAKFVCCWIIFSPRSYFSDTKPTDTSLGEYDGQREEIDSITAMFTTSKHLKERGLWALAF